MRPRVLGRNVILLVHSEKWLLPIALGELEEFTSTSTTELIKSRPVGYSLEAATLRYGGYDLSFKIGKTDPFMERWGYLIDRGLISGSQPPKLFIVEIIRHYDNIGTIGGDSVFGVTLPSYGGLDLNIAGQRISVTENWIYKDVTLFAPDISINANEGYEQSIRGFSPWKELGPVDFTFLQLNWLPQLGFQEVVIKTANVEGGIVQDITSLINSQLNKPKQTINKPSIVDSISQDVAGGNPNAPWENF